MSRCTKRFLFFRIEFSFLHTYLFHARCFRQRTCTIYIYTTDIHFTYAFLVITLLARLAL